jgi:tRNA/rRNA methyltransferase
MGENIGAAARVMRNFGLSDLAIVAPRDGWPNPEAYTMAAGADVILDNARLCQTIAEAVTGCQHVLATTARGRGMAKPVTNARDYLPQAFAASSAGAPAAILFGPERTGLENDELMLADGLITIPTAPEHGSLNLAQTVAILAYEWRMLALAEEKPSIPAHLPAPREAMDNLLTHLEQALEEGGFFREPNLRETMRRNIANQLMRGQWSEQEVRTFHGIIAALSGKKTTPRHKR